MLLRYKENHAESHCACSLQCCVYVDKPASGGVGAVWFRAGRARPGASDNQRGPGRAPPHRGCGCYRGPRGNTHKLQGREATHAPSRLIPRRPAGSHLCCLQHVRGRHGGSRLVHSSSTVYGPDRWLKA